LGRDGAALKVDFRLNLHTIHWLIPGSGCTFPASICNQLLAFFAKGRSAHLSSYRFAWHWPIKHELPLTRKALYPPPSTSLGRSLSPGYPAQTRSFGVYQPEEFPGRFRADLGYVSN